MDIWDWLRGLRRWWWMIVVFPLIAATIAWMAAPQPRYESSWSLNIYFDDPNLANSPGYIDFVLLDDFDLLMRTGVLGDVMYTRLPEDVQARLDRHEFGAMFHSSRKARFIEITVVGDDPELIRTVANTLNDNLTEVTNLYLVPPDYHLGPATVNVLDPISEPTLNTRDRLVTVSSVIVGTLLASIAATGVAEWLGRSYRAKYSAR